MPRCFLSLVFLLLWPITLDAQPSLRVSSLFSDHMVLQREQEVTVWGDAAPGDEISVVFADQKKSTVCLRDGRWMIRLSPLKASRESRDLSVSSKKENRAVKISDVVVGDVWLCSGQSNMHFRMAGVENAKAEIAAAHQPLLRFFTVGEQLAQAPAHDVAGKWQGATAETIASCSAVAYYFGAELQKKSDLPIGLLVSSVGGTRIESWMRPETIAATGESRSLVDQWKKMSADEFQKIAAEYRAFQYQRDHAHPHQVSAARAKGEPIPPAPIQPRTRCHDCPSSLHHGMIAPLQPYAIRGVIWYQGESNSSQPKSYEKLLPAMIADWRQAWGKEMPFLFVQLASYRDTHPAFRLAQQRIWQKTAHTALVVTTDVGDAANIHPIRKRPVGERLALAARSLCGGESVESSGPLFESMKIQADRAIISFSHCSGGLMAKGGELRGFAIAGSDQKFLPATASIEGDTVVVSCDQIKAPVAVRYNWAKMAEGNLYNRAGLPAYMISTCDPTPVP
jgi:sialate O-acetylesterase